MSDKYIWICVVGLISILMLFFNRKVRLFSLIKEQMLVFKNDKSGKISLWDIISFFAFPLIISLILVYKLDFTVDVDGKTPEKIAREIVSKI